VISLDGTVDPAGGIQGLPERATTLFVDGHAFQPARHPASAADPARGLIVPRGAISAVGLPATLDIEWGGHGGNPVAVSTGVSRGSVPEILGIVGPDAGWSGRALPSDPPSFASWWGSAATTLTLRSDTARVHVALDRGRWHRPPSPAGLRLCGRSPGGGLARGSRGIELDVGVAEARLDLKGGGMLQASIVGASFESDAPRWPSPNLRYLAQPGAIEGTDVAAGSSLSLALTGPFALEIRAEGSMSRRRFGGSADEATASTVLVNPALLFGSPSQDRGEVRRSDAGGTAAIHFTAGPHRLKAGLRGSVASHQYDLAQQPRGTFLFGDAARVGGAGVFEERSGALPATSFVVPEGEIFGHIAGRP
jgi:hypothetical protein